MHQKWMQHPFKNGMHTPYLTKMGNARTKRNPVLTSLYCFKQYLLALSVAKGIHSPTHRPCETWLWLSLMCIDVLCYSRGVVGVCVSGRALPAVCPGLRAPLGRVRGPHRHHRPPAAAPRQGPGGPAPGPGPGPVLPGRRRLLAPAHLPPGVRYPGLHGREVQRLHRLPRPRAPRLQQIRLLLGQQYSWRTYLYKCHTCTSSLTIGRPWVGVSQICLWFIV